MQGRKIFEDEKELFFSLSAHVPEHNFYRRLKQQLNLDFLYEETEEYYGRCGQQSIDPVVFFKLCLVGYLENITSDRKLIEHCSLRLDLLFFWVISSMNHYHGTPQFPVPVSSCQRYCLRTCLAKSSADV